MPPHPHVVATPSRWELAAKVALAAGALVVPLFIGTWTPDQWEIHKTLVLMAVVTVAWFCFSLAQFRRPMAAWHWHPLDWLVLGLGFATLIGTVTSVSWRISVFGIQGTYAETLPVTIAMISYYFLSTRLFRTSTDRLVVWSALLTGIGTALLAQLFQFSDVSLLPSSLAKIPLFSPLANANLQAALLAAVLSTIGLLLWSRANERWSRLCVMGMVAVGWLVLFFLGQAIAWALFTVGMILVVISQTARSPQSSRLVVVAVILAAVGMLSQFLKVNSYTSLPPTNELTLSQTTSAATAFSVLAKRPVLGTGPNTWYDAFVQYRPLSFNSDAHWSNRYLRAGAEWSQLLATQGVVGLALWVGIFVLAGWEFWRRMKAGYSFSVLVGLFAILALAISGALTSWSLTLLFFGWVALGLGRAKIAVSEPAKSSKPGVMPALGFALTVIAAVVLWYPAMRVYASQIMLTKAQHHIDAQKPLAGIMTILQSAVRYDSHNLDAAALLANANAVAIQNDLKANDINKARAHLQAATATIRSAVVRDPTNPAAYEAENNLLNSLSSYLPDPEQQANHNFAKLRQLEPTNPIHDVGYGQTLMVIRARASSGQSNATSASQAASQLQAAIAAFDDALSKKSDYLQARYARSTAELIGGQFQTALDDANQLTSAEPSVASFWAAKGAAQAGLNQLDQAKDSFEQALTLDPNDPNIYLSYSQAYQDAKKTTEAKDVLNRGLKVIPGDSQLTQALAALGK